MKPRKFFAPNSREVLKLVREALGPDALIVSNAKVAGGVEVVALPATVIGDLVAGAGRAETAAPAAPSAGATAASREAAVARTVSAAVAAETRRRELATAPAKPAMPAAPAEPPAPAETVAAARAPSREALSDALMQNMMAELRNMRAVLEQRLSGLAWTELSRRDPSKVSALQTLLTAGFSGG